MNYAVDLGRLVIQCGCERAVRWSGEEPARAQGWHGGWRPGHGGELRRVWTCSECYRPPAPARSAEEAGLPGYLRALLESPAHRELAIEQLELARAGDQVRWGTWLDELAAMLPGLRRGMRARWVGYLQRHGREPEPDRDLRPRSRWERAGVVLTLVYLEWAYDAGRVVDQVAVCRADDGSERRVSARELAWDWQPAPRRRASKKATAATAAEGRAP